MASPRRHAQLLVETDAVSHSKGRDPTRQGAIRLSRRSGSASSTSGTPPNITSASKEAGNIPRDDYFEPSERSNALSRAHSEEVRRDSASPVLPPGSEGPGSKASTELRAGLVQKQFFIATELLTSKSPYFASLARDTPQPVITTATNMQSQSAVRGPFFFPDLDEFAMALFVRWLHGGVLHGPTDFHSMNHYLCLYVLARRFDVEELLNRVMDLVRHYYHSEQMTAPAFRLEYIYSNTEPPCLMRDFLIRTAAYRALSESEKGITESVRGAIRGGGDLAIDFVNAMLEEVKTERVDVRKGDDCRWHEHKVTAKCNSFSGFEPYETA